MVFLFLPVAAAGLRFFIPVLSHVSLEQEKESA